MEQPTLTLVQLEANPLPGVESYSPFCLKAHRALKAAGLRYTDQPAFSPSVRKRHNPTGQVPVLLVGGEAVADSTNILRRVLQMAPGRIAESPEAWLWEELADTALNGFLVAARWADDRNWPLVRRAYFGGMPALLRAIVTPRLRKTVVGNLVARDVWRAGAAACWERFGRLLDQLDGRAPAEGFWLGGPLSVADIALFAQLHSFRTPLTPWQAEELGRRTRLVAYLDRVDAATREEDATALRRAS